MNMSDVKPGRSVKIKVKALKNTIFTIGEFCWQTAFPNRDFIYIDELSAFFPADCVELARDEKIAMLYPIETRKLAVLVVDAAIKILKEDGVDPGNVNNKGSFAFWITGWDSVKNFLLSAK